MNDDWDGGDWAGLFSGPSEYEIERQQESDHQSSQSSEEYRGENFEVVSTQLLQKEKNTFESFIIASAFAKQMAAMHQQALKIKETQFGWAVIEDRLTSVEVSNIREFITRDDGYFAAIELMDAMQKKDHELARQLLEKPINVNVRDNRGVSPLMIAAYRGYSAICEKLLKLGAEITDETFSGYDVWPFDITLWQRAKMSGDQQTIDVIDEAYATANWNNTKKMSLTDPNKIQVYGPEHLLEAARLGMTTLCVEIVSSGIEINIPKLTHNKGDLSTPLSKAFDGGHITTCFVLVALGADTSVLKMNDNFSDEFESRYTPDEKAQVAQLINRQIWQQSVRDQFSGGAK